MESTIKWVENFTERLGLALHRQLRLKETKIGGCESKICLSEGQKEAKKRKLVCLRLMRLGQGQNHLQRGLQDARGEGEEEEKVHHPHPWERRE